MSTALRRMLPSHPISVTTTLTQPVSPDAIRDRPADQAPYLAVAAMATVAGQYGVFVRTARPSARFVIM